MVIWIYGLSGSGKTYLSKKIFNILRKKNFKVLRIDGDIIRKVFTDLNYTIEDRKINAERISKLSNILSQQNRIVIVSVLSLFPKWIKWNKKKIKNYFQIYINVPVKKLILRNSKKIYRRTSSGKLNNNVAGVGIPFLRLPYNDLIINNKFNYKSLKKNLNIIFTNKKFLQGLEKVK